MVTTRERAKPPPTPGPPAISADTTRKSGRARKAVDAYAPMVAAVPSAAAAAPKKHKNLKFSKQQVRRRKPETKAQFR